MDNFFTHSLSHYIGRDVHGSDLGFSSSSPVAVGRVFSIEPGIYIASEGFGVRLEDDFVMTESGAVNLYVNTPIEIADIEALMASSESYSPPLQGRSARRDDNAPASEHMTF
jgi:Xaa-Pro aminopeptidase